MVNKFEKFNLDKNIIKSLNNMKYEEPSKVQDEVIPFLLEKIDINNNCVQGLIIAPTRELALQIKEEIQNIGRIKKVRCSAIFGKQPLKDQISELKQRVHIVVGTPGRIIDHIGRGTIDLSNIKFFIIDEADKMLNKGFVDDMESILSKLPKNCCKGMISATIDDNMQSICQKYMKNIKSIEIKSDDINIKKQISEYCIKVEKENKYEVLKDIIYSECPKSLIIFANTRDKVDEIYKKMKKDKFILNEIHGDMSQDKWLFIIKDFKENKFNILVSSDITSRGIHIDDISLVINYDVPENKENYIHRIGRTGRVDKLGKAITMVFSREEKYLNEIENYTGNKIEEIIQINEDDIKNGKEKFENLQKNLLKNKKPNKLEKNTNDEVTKIYLNVGKKKKIRVVDIVGAFSNVKGLTNEDIGVIEVKDVCSYVDILNYKGENFLKNNKSRIIKKKEVKVKRDNS